jgi:LPS-assembly protein
MPQRRRPRASTRMASLGLTTLALVFPAAMTASSAYAANGQTGKNVVLSADTVTKDDINNVVSASGHVELVQGGAMLLAEHIVWNQNTDIVTATGDVKLVDDQGNIDFGDYLEITDDMREAFVRNVSSLLSDNSRMVGREAEKDGNVTIIHRGIYSPCELCKDNPTTPPTWQIKADKVIHDTDTKRLYYHDATFQIDGVPIVWTPYFSTYDPSVKRASGILEVMPGYRSQLGTYLKGSYYFDLAPDMDAVLEMADYSEQGPLIGGQFRERFSSGQIQLSGSIAESNIRQYPLNSPDPDAKTIRGHIFGNGEFDLSDNWRAGFEFARSLDNLYVLKYQFSSLQVLPTHLYAEGFYDRDYINASLYSFQDLRANIVADHQPTALPYITYSFFGDPGETLGGRWADSGSLLTLRRYPGESIERVANNVSWSRKMVSDWGLVTNLNASTETDYYFTQDPAPDPITGLDTVKKSTGRVFPQAYAVTSYPLERPIGYANLIVEPTVSVVGSPTYTNDAKIPNEDSNDIQIDAANIFSGNRFPGVDRLEGGSRVTYGIKTGLYNLGTGYTTLFLGQSYNISGINSTPYPPESGLNTRFSDFVGEFEMVPGKYFDFDYRFELANDLSSNRLQEVNFRIGPDNFGFYGTYLFASQVTVSAATPATAAVAANLAAAERNELNASAYYRFDDHWSVTASETAELTHPRAVLRYSLAAGYSDDCSSFTLNISHDQTLIVGGTSGTAVQLVFSLKNLGVFATPSIH